MAQTLVNSLPQNKKVLIEEFTGVNCGFCPDGHAIAAGIKAANLGDVVTVNIHAGGFAVPSAGQIDFRTPQGDSIDTFFGITGYPSGVVARQPFGGALVLNRGQWSAATLDALQQPSPVNLGMRSTFNSVTRDLAVEVAVAYSANGTGANDYISVYLLESDIIGEQIDYSATPQTVSNYQHNHAFRAALTPSVWGDQVSINSAGQTDTRTYNYNVPTSFDIANCHVVAFIGEYQGEVYQAREVEADGGTTLITSTLDMAGASTFGSGSAGQSSTFSPQFTNLLPQTEDFTFNLSSPNAPASWNASYSIGGNTYSGMNTLSMMSNSTVSVDVTVTPGADVGVAQYVLTASSVSNPNAPVLTETFTVISGVTDLIIDNQGAEVHGPIYDAGLALAAQPGAARTGINEAMSLAAGGALSDIVNIYYNVSWTFPAFLDVNIAELETLMDGGVNLFIAGQDIGWDVMSGAANSNGTPAQQDFYQNYMLASYVDDGSSANSEINFVAGDGVYGWTPNTTINSVFGTNSYPEVISPQTDASSVFHYNTPSLTGGVRGETSDFKVVYFGVGLEQFSDPAVAHEALKRAHDWFYGAVSTEEFDAGMADLFTGVYPVPASNQLTVELSEQLNGGSILLLDMSGKVVLQETVRSTKNVLNTQSLAPGAYSLQVRSSEGMISGIRTVQVVH